MTTPVPCDGCGATERVCVLLPAGEMDLVLVALCEPCMGWLRDGSHPLATPAGQDAPDAIEAAFRAGFWAFSDGCTENNAWDDYQREVKR